jgi:hypothetical protein
MVVIERPAEADQHLCADKGYSGEPGEEIEVKKTIPGYKARRWVVEVAHSWFNRFRKLLVRYEKLTGSYEALLHLAAAIICWRKIGIIYG